MTYEELKNDCNFYPAFETPGKVVAYALDNANMNTKYCSWLQMMGSELVIRTFAFRSRKQNNYCLELTEVERKTPGLEWAVRKNCYLTSMSGYRVVYEPKNAGHSTYYGYETYLFNESEFDKWCTEKPMGIYSHLLNLDKVFEIEKYKHCGFSRQQDLMEYLKLYEEYPEVEYFGKLGLKVSKALLWKCKKDRQFIRFLRDNVYKANLYGPKVTIYAYEAKLDFAVAEGSLMIKRDAERMTKKLRRVKELGVDRIGIYEYIQSNDISSWTYRDYWEACLELGLDMHDTKNCYPRDFQRMHDLRIQEYQAKKEKMNAQKKKKMVERFKKESAKYEDMLLKSDDLTLVLPKTPKDLVREGNKLHHCVGHMGYDKKMADGESLIVFVRKTDDIEKPFVTVEYIFKQRRVAQIYGDHDSRPPQEVIDFVNEWAEGFKKQLKKKGVGA